MILILARNKVHYQSFIRKFGLDYLKYRYVYEWSDCRGHWVDTPVIMLEGWEQNHTYSLGLMEKIGNRFDNIGLISEGEYFADEEVSIQYFSRT